MGLASKLNKQGGALAPGQVVMSSQPAGAPFMPPGQVVSPPQMGMMPPMQPSPIQPASIQPHQPPMMQASMTSMPPPAAPQTFSTGVGVQAGSAGILASLRQCVADNNLHAFYNEQALHQAVSRCEGLQTRVAALCHEWNLPSELTYDLYKLALYDVVMLCDDSGSMIFEEKGERVQDLEMIISYVARATALFDHDGISVRFLNSTVTADGITDSNQVHDLIKKVTFKGLTPMGTELDNKIIQPFFINEMRTNNLRKPLLAIVITDGTPAGESTGKLESVLSSAYRASNGGIGLSVAFAQVGTDQASQRFLAELDSNREFGRMVDVTSNFELEQAELLRKGVDMSPQMWICKLLLGSIDPSYDSKDE